MRYLALLIILVIFWPVSVVQAQSGRVPTPVCIKNDASDVKYPYQGTQCPTNYTKIDIINTVQAPFVGVCVGLANGELFADEPIRPAANDPNGQLRCTEGQLYTKNAIQTAGPPNSNSNSDSNSNSNSNRNSNSNSNSNRNDNTGGGPQTNICESGFHEVGPLCIPDSPFSNSNGVAGSSTLGELIVRVINILLFIAGIVAVIMAIIGGYYIMTAGGNPTQAVNGRKTLTNAIIGLVIVVFSYVIIQVVINFITN